MYTQRDLQNGRSGGAGWAGLFWDAFKQSRNAMVLLDHRRRHVEVNGAYLALLGYPRTALIGRRVSEVMAHGRLASDTEWDAALRRTQFTGVADLRRADGRVVRVSFAGHPEVVTGRQLVLGVAIRASRARPRLGTGEAHSATPVALSARELDVIELVARGLSGPEISQELHITHNTVRTHVRNSLTKTGARSRAHLVAKLLGEGLLWNEARITQA